MNNQDILMNICSHLNNNSIESLSKTSLWVIIREFANNQHFWYLRVQHLMRGMSMQEMIAQQEARYKHRELKPRENQDWKTAYYILSHALRVSIIFTRKVLENELAVDILLELGHTPSPDVLISSCHRSRIDIIKNLLADDRVDPSASHRLIMVACNRDHPEIIKLLLEDGRADPSGEDNYVIRYASANGYTEIVKLLLADKRIDPSAENNCAILNACWRRHIGIIKLLLEDGRSDPSICNNYSLQYAKEQGHTEVVELLLQDQRVLSRR